MAPDGTIAEEDDVELHPEGDMGGAFRQLDRQGDQLLVYGSSAAGRDMIPPEFVGYGFMFRFSLSGELVALSRVYYGAAAFSAPEGRPIVWFRAPPVVENDGDYRMILADYFGCEPQGDGQ